ncbi:MAG: AAA family ATPase [Saprospiraceae bacterium]|nr:AAA family ATPase [Saprospiraceae bacterium]
MIYIDRNSVPVPEVFHSGEMKIAKKRLDEFYSRSEGSRSQERYSRPFEPQLTKEIIGSLRLLFKNKCAYCESPLPPASTTGNIENFRPKSNARGLEKDFSREHYWWLTYEWENLYFTCEKCNRYKSSWFPVEGKRAKPLTPLKEIRLKEKTLLVDPCFDRPEEHLVYDDKGNVDFLTAKGKTTIGILKLNRADLITARQETVKLLFQSCEEMLLLWNKKRKSKNKIKVIALKWEDIFTSFSAEPYVAIQRQLLSKWLSTHSDLQTYLANKEYDYEELIAIEMEALGAPKVIEEIKQFDKEMLADSEKELIEDSINFDNLKHVYIEKIVLNNFKCFTDLTINFSNDKFDSNSETELSTEPWLLFLGENGVGKSSILKAITIALCGENYFEKLGLDPSSLLQRNKKNGFINLFLKGEKEPIEIKFDSKKITTNIKEPKANLIGYGSVRLLPKERKLSPERFRQGGIKAQNLFDYSVSLTNADKWLLDRKEDDFQRAALTLKDLMLLEPDVVLKEMRSMEKYLFKMEIPH